MSTWTLVTSVATTISPILFTTIGTRLGIANKPQLYGPLIMAFVVLGYIPAAFTFFIAGRRYSEEQVARGAKAREIA